MNKLINKYLANLEFYVGFELNESFEETIKSTKDEKKIIYAETKGEGYTRDMFSFDTRSKLLSITELSVSETFSQWFKCDNFE